MRETDHKKKGNKVHHHLNMFQDKRKIYKHIFFQQHHDYYHELIGHQSFANTR